MQIKEAYSILEISQSASPEEIKKKYKELTKKYHPDINKADDAESKFKKINEAYQVITNHNSNTNDSINYDDMSNPFSNIRHTINASNIDLYATISFKDSVIGFKKDLKFNRSIKCENCDGNGRIKLNNGCKSCSGTGMKTIKHNNMIFSQTCDKCHNKFKIDPCAKCNSTGMQEVETSISVNIPGGITNFSILRLNGMGNYYGNFIGMPQYTDAHLHVTVTPEEGLSLDGNDVISTIEISLLDALRGASKNIKTILGDKEIVINPLSKNKDEIIVSGLGVPKLGNQRVILNVKYPEDVSELLNVLDKKDTYNAVDVK